MCVWSQTLTQPALRFYSLAYADSRFCRLKMSQGDYEVDLNTGECLKALPVLPETLGCFPVLTYDDIMIPMNQQQPEQEPKQSSSACTR